MKHHVKYSKEEIFISKYWVCDVFYLFYSPRLSVSCCRISCKLSEGTSCSWSSCSWSSCSWSFCSWSSCSWSTRMVSPPRTPAILPQLGNTATQHPLRQLRYLEKVCSENFSWHYLVYISLKLTWWWSLMGFRISHIILLSIIHHLLVYGLKCMHRNSAPLFCLFSSLHSVCSILKSNIKDLKFYISYKDLIWQLFKV